MALSIAGLDDEKSAELTSEWKIAVQHLTGKVTAWAEQQGWKVTSIERAITEPPLSVYHIPVLEIETSIKDEFGEAGRVVLEPIARNVLRSDGRVDLYAWPSHTRVMLLLRPTQGWVVRTDSGIDWPQPWNKASFLDLTQRLVEAS